MKTLIVECKFVIEVPWKEEWSDPHFQIEENSCPGTSAVGSVLDAVMEAADKESICWACKLGGENKILAIEDREPRDYRAELTPIETEATVKCDVCQNEMVIKSRMIGNLSQTASLCPHCNTSSHTLSM